jgi:hypothetical protein
MGSPLVGRLGKIVLGTYPVANMVSWKMDGVKTEEIDSTSFTDTAKQFELGITDYGAISLSGYYNKADTTGQDLLISANINKSKIGNAFKLYVDSTSYWTPNVTANSSAGFYVSSFSIGFDVNGLGKIDFTGRCTGPWVLV